MLFTLDEQSAKLSAGNNIKYTVIALGQIVRVDDLLDELDYLQIHRTGNMLIDAAIIKLRGIWAVDWGC